MSNLEKCKALLESFSEEELAHIADMLANRSPIMEVARKLEEDLGSAVIDNVAKLYDDMGSSLYTATRIFYEESLIQGGFPFEVCTDVPNAVTLAAMEEAERMLNDPNTKKYDNLEELFKEWRS